MDEEIAVSRDEGSYFHADLRASRNSMRAHHLEEVATLRPGKKSHSVHVNYEELKL
jgi:hypothetical protein